MSRPQGTTPASLPVMIPQPRRARQITENASQRPQHLTGTPLDLRRASFQAASVRASSIIVTRATEKPLQAAPTHPGLQCPQNLDNFLKLLNDKNLEDEFSVLEQQIISNLKLNGWMPKIFLNENMHDLGFNESFTRLLENPAILLHLETLKASADIYKITHNFKFPIKVRMQADQLIANFTIEFNQVNRNIEYLETQVRSHTSLIQKHQISIQKHQISIQNLSNQLKQEKEENTDVWKLINLNENISWTEQAISRELNDMANRQKSLMSTKQKLRTCQLRVKNLKPIATYLDQNQNAGTNQYQPIAFALQKIVYDVLINLKHRIDLQTKKDDDEKSEMERLRTLDRGQLWGTLLAGEPLPLK